MLRRCAAKLQSVVAMLTSKVIFYMASNFYKNKILNFLFNEIVSVAFTFSLLIFSHSISNVEKYLPEPSVGSKMAS